MLIIILKWVIKRLMFKKLKEKLKVPSATVAVGGTIAATGMGIFLLPGMDKIITDLVPDRYDGLAVAVLGLIVAVARLRTLGK